ncbi:Uncharacterised protein [uncultured archaeon]|nr:Uncharacterised protein [uncultured archaeon]
MMLGSPTPRRSFPRQNLTMYFASSGAAPESSSDSSPIFASWLPLPDNFDIFTKVECTLERLFGAEKSERCAFLPRSASAALPKSPSFLYSVSTTFSLKPDVWEMARTASFSPMPTSSPS